MAEHEPNEVRMSFGEHLEELRLRLIYALVGIAVGAGIGVFFGRDLIYLICTPLLEVQHFLGLPPQVYNLAPAAGFAVFMQVGLVAGLVISAPWVLYQGWKFISAGLYAAERKVVLILAPFSAVMSVLAVLFLYYFMLPVCLMFLLRFATHYPVPHHVGQPGLVFRMLNEGLSAVIPSPEKEKEKPTPAGTPPVVRIPILTVDPPHPVQGQVWLKVPENELRVRSGKHIRSLALTTTSLMSPLIDINQYLQFVGLLTLGCLIAFQVPVVLTILAMTGLVDPRWLAKYRKYYIFAAFVAGALLTPPDVFSQIMMVIPLLTLFEVGLVAMRLVYRRETTSE